MHQQRAEGLAFQLHEVVLAHQAAGVDVAAADHVGNQRGNVEVVGADEAAVAHVDQRAFDGGRSAATGHGKLAFVRGAVAAGKQGAGLVEGHKEQLVLVRHHHIAVEQIAQLARLQRAGAHLGHGRCGEAFGEEGHQVFAGGVGGVFCGAPGNVGQAASAGHQAHAHFYQADVALHGHHAACRVRRQFTAAAQRQAPHGRDHRHIGVAQFEHHALHFQLGTFNGGHTGHRKAHQHGLQISPGGEHRVGRPNHQPLKIFFGQVDRAVQAFHHAGIQRVHFGFDAGDQHRCRGVGCFVERPQTNGGVFVQRAAHLLGFGCVGTQHALGEMLAREHRQAARWHKSGAGRVPGTLRHVHATGIGHRAVEHPVGQRRIAQGFAGINVFLDHVGHGQPAGFLPQFKRALLHAKAPAQTQVDVARIVGNGR